MVVVRGSESALDGLEFLVLSVVKAGILESMCTLSKSMFRHVCWVVVVLLSSPLRDGFVICALSRQ